MPTLLLVYLFYKLTYKIEAGRVEMMFFSAFLSLLYNMSLRISESFAPLTALHQPGQEQSTLFTTTSQNSLSFTTHDQYFYDVNRSMQAMPPSRQIAEQCK